MVMNIRVRKGKGSGISLLPLQSDVRVDLSVGMDKVAKNCHYCGCTPSCEALTDCGIRNRLRNPYN